jgi:hypothetical protein
MSGQALAQAKVAAPDEVSYLVRVARNSSIKRPTGNTDIIDAVVDNLRVWGKTGWKISVLTVPTTTRASREIFRQDVLAQAIVADIALVVVEAIRRGDRLWAEDE